METRDGVLYAERWELINACVRTGPYENLKKGDLINLLGEIFRVVAFGDRLVLEKVVYVTKEDMQRKSMAVRKMGTFLACCGIMTSGVR